MTWVLIIAVAWLVVSVVAALLIAGTISLADRRHTRSTTSDQGNVAVELPTAGTTPPAPRVVAGEEPRRTAPPARTPVVRDCIPPAERATRTRQTGTR